MSAAPTAYDDFAYPGRVFSQTHPNRLAVLATMHGMTPAPPERCRVLEVGCGDGLNLLALAQVSPGSTFVGFDLAARPIAFGREIADEVGLTNLNLFQADLMEYEPDGSFDYIIAHGFLSWVPQPVQLRLFDLCRRALAPQGVAIISYNTYPGFHVRRMMREMLQFHGKGATDPQSRIAKARGLIQFLLAGQRSEDEFASLLRHEAEWMLNRASEAVLLHDDLAEINIPFYIREFAALAQAHDLQFLSEADYFEMNFRAYAPPVVEALSGLKDIILREQYIDFLKCRRFRQSLVTHRSVELNREPHPHRVRGFLITSPVEPASERPNLAPGVIEAFDGPRSGALKLDHALSKAALVVLRATWPRPLPFDELLTRARELLDPHLPTTSDDEDVLTEVLLQMHANGVAEFHLHRPVWVTTVSERPVVSPLLRALLRREGAAGASLRPITLLIEAPPFRALAMLLDGTRDRTSLEAEMRRLFDVGAFSLPEGATADQIPELIEAMLRKLAKDAVLIA